MEEKTKSKPGPKPETLKLDIPLEEALKRLVTPKDNKRKGKARHLRGSGR